MEGNDMPRAAAPVVEIIEEVVEQPAPPISLIAQIAMLSPEERAAVAALLGSAPAPVVEEPLPPRPVDPSPDKMLDTPIRFWNDKHRFESVYIDGKKRKFINGQFIARTEHEADMMRRMGTHVFEGDNVSTPIRCKTCRREFLNSLVALDHMDRHAVA